MDVVVAAILDTLGPALHQLVRDEVRAAVEGKLPTWLTVEQAAERIGIGRSAVRERIRQGVIPGRKWEGRWYVRAVDVDAAIEGRSAATVARHFTNGPSAVAAAPAPTTRKEP